MEFRPYDPERDLDDCIRIYGEIGWASSSDDDKRAAGLHQAVGRTLVAVHDGAVEAFASNQDGSMRYLDADLPTCVVAGVGTGRVARRLGFAKRLTAEALAADVIEKGVAVAVLGMFDQGFYDKIGFGTGNHDRMVAFDPKDLRVPAPSRPPLRLTADDWKRMHAGRVASMRLHGSIVLLDDENTQSEVLIHKDGFGLGFADEAGALTHHVWITADDVSQGPYAVRWMSYRDGRDLLELLGVLRDLADQIHVIRVVEPLWFQLWDLLDRPWRRRSLSVGSKHEAFSRALPWWQLRICDVDQCIAAVRLPMSDSLRFNLTLTDPIREHLTEATAKEWGGVAGDYLVRIGAESAVEAREPDPSLPTLRASVNSFSRLWYGVLPARGLAITSSDFEGPPELLQRLDAILRLPQPWLGWDI